jgi:hypothetical protein
MTTSTSPPAFVCLGDIHLDSIIWRRYRQIAMDAFVGFTSFIDTGIRLHLPIVILGDLFDSVDPDPELVRYFRREMDKCEAAGCPVFAIQGNHDKRPIPWYCALHTWPRHVGDGRPLMIGGLMVRGYDYAPFASIKESLEDLGRADSKPQVLFLHQAARQALDIEGAWNCDLEWVPKEVPLIMMGDIHTQTEYRVRENQMAYYTGPSHARDISQIGPKTCCLVHQDLSVVRLPITYREIKKFLILTPDDLPLVRKWLEFVLSTPQVLKPVAWIHYAGASHPECMRLAIEHDEVAITVLEPAKEGSQTKGEADTPVMTVGELLSKESLVAKLADPEKEPEVYSLVLELTKTQNVNEAITAARERFHAGLSKET